MQGLSSVPGSIARSRCRGSMEGFHLLGDLELHSLPFHLTRADEHGLNKHHDLVAVGIVCSKLAALVRIETAFKERPEDRRVNIAPIEPGRFEDQRNLCLLEWEGLMRIKPCAFWI